MRYLFWDLNLGPRDLDLGPRDLNLGPYIRFQDFNYLTPFLKD